MRRPGSFTRSLSASAAARPSPFSAPAPPHGVATARPTAQFTHHHDVAAPRVDSTAFRQGWQVATRLNALFEAGRVDREAWDIAHEWRRWVEITTPYRVQSWDMRVDQSRVANDAAMLLRVNAATKLREAAESLGELRTRLLAACVVRDQPWTEIGKLLRASDKTARDYVVEALAALADWRTGRPVAARPVLRYRVEPGRQ